jgi:parallel beta-helix repeat protein
MTFSVICPVAIIPMISANAAAAASIAACISYDQSSSSIIVRCNASKILDIYNILKGRPNTISKENVSSKVWILNANLVIENGATLYINSTDTSWLKINSTDGIAHGIVAHGNLVIDSVKITSWDVSKHDYATTDDIGTIPRSYILVKQGTGTTNISNSEIAYLGYLHEDSFGLVYNSGAGSTILNNKIHDLLYGFYSKSKNAYNITIKNNEIYRNGFYGIDPHIDSRNLIISNNKIYGNGKHGIVCSANCYNIVIESNRVFNNVNDGIVLNDNVSHSTVRNNVVYNNRDNQIVLQNLANYNYIYLNSVKGGRTGIRISESSNNTIQNNSILDPSQYGIHLLRSASENIIASNNVSGASSYSLFIQDPQTDDNIFRNNYLRVENKQNAIQILNLSKSHAVLLNNIIYTNSDHSLGISLLIIIFTALAIVVVVNVFLIRRMGLLKSRPKQIL